METKIILMVMDMVDITMEVDIPLLHMAVTVGMVFLPHHHQRVSEDLLGDEMIDPTLEDFHLDHLHKLNITSGLMEDIDLPRERLIDPHYREAEQVVDRMLILIYPVTAAQNRCEEMIGEMTDEDVMIGWTEMIADIMGIVRGIMMIEVGVGGREVGVEVQSGSVTEIVSGKENLLIGRGRGRCIGVERGNSL